MVAQSAPTVENHRTRFLGILHIVEKDVVDPPCIVKRVNFRVVKALLPVNPPETDALAGHRVENILEKTVHETTVGRYPRHILLGSGIDAIFASHFRISLLIVLHSRCRMQIESHFQVLVAKMVEKFLRFREKSAVPGPAGPSSMSFIGVMPVHVNNENLYRDSVVVEVLHQFSDFMVGISPPSRPPESECIAGRDRNVA